VSDFSRSCSARPIKIENRVRLQWEFELTDPGSPRDLGGVWDEWSGVERVDSSSCLVREPGAEPSPIGEYAPQIQNRPALKKQPDPAARVSLAHLGPTPMTLRLARCSTLHRPAKACNCLPSDNFSIPGVIVVSAPPLLVTALALTFRPPSLPGLLPCPGLPASPGLVVLSTAAQTHSVCGARVPILALVACGGARSRACSGWRAWPWAEVTCSYSCGPVRVHDDLADVPVRPARAARVSTSLARNVPGTTS
jgi:hypothetical protein